MNTVIHALWVGEDQSPLIMPASIPIGTAAANSELAQYRGRTSEASERPERPQDWPRWKGSPSAREACSSHSASKRPPARSPSE